MIAEPAAATGAVLHHEWPLVDLGEPDAERIGALFAEVFGKPMSRELWDWKYGSGRGTAVGIVHPDGSLVAHYGVTKRPMVYENAIVPAVHAGDVMVAPRVRHVFSRRGPFARLTEGIVEKCFGARGFAQFGFGFPNARHFELGTKLGFYWPLETMWELRWDRPLRIASGFAVSPQPWGVQWVYDYLVKVFQEDSGAHPDLLRAARTPDVWRHRFANHPQFRYQLFVVAMRGRPCGAFVLKDGEGEVPCELLDWIAIPGCENPLFAFAVKAALARGSRSLMVWASSAAVNALPHAVAAAAASRSHACNVASAQSQVLGKPAQRWQGSVWLTGADTDFH